MTLRARLFIGTGLILLFTSLLSYFLPDYLMRNELDRAAATINQMMTTQEERVAALLKNLLMAQLNATASELDALIQVVGKLDGLRRQDFYTGVAALLPLNPHLAFVERREATGDWHVVSPIHFQPHPFRWIPEGKGGLIVVEERHLVFRAQEVHEGQYLLYPETMTPSPRLGISYPAQVTDWAEQVSLLVPFLEAYAEDDTLAGYVDLDAGALLLGDEILTPVVTQGSPLGADPSGNLYLTRILSEGEASIILGFSLSDLFAEMGQLLKKAAVIVMNHQDYAGYTELGTAFQPLQAQFPLKALAGASGTLSWNQTIYCFRRVEMGVPWNAEIYVLTPQSDLFSVMSILSQVRAHTLQRLSTHLLVIIALIFVLALLLIARLTARTTKPIALLARAAETVGEGHYDQVSLPQTTKRTDEIATLTREFHGMIGALKDRETIRGVLDKVLSKEIAAEILRNKIELGGEERCATVLFSDIRGFTHLVENGQPKILITQLNGYLTEMCQLIEEQGGVIDKFVGDEIMALYGVLINDENQAAHAIASALAMLERLNILNHDRQAQGLPSITIGIGVHTGVVVAGNVGSANRLSYTVLGASVNLASRLCQAAQPMQLLVSAATKAAAGAAPFHYEPLPPMSLKGISQPVSVFSVTRATKTTP